MKKLLFGLNNIAVVGLIFAYISPYIDPARSWFFSIFGLGYPFLLVVNIFFLLYWMYAKPKYALLPGIFLVLGFTPLQKAIGFNTPKTTVSGLTVMTYNIGKTRVDFHKKGKEKKIARFKEYIQEVKPDVICIQERLPRHLDYYKKIFIDYKLHPSSDIGTAIYSKYPIVKSGNIPFNTKSHNATWADIKIHGKTIRFYSLHLSSNRVTNLTDNMQDIWSETKYILSKYHHHAVIRSQQIKEVLKHADKSPHPVVISGDFNDVPQSYIYNQIDKKYKDAFREHGIGLAQTFKSRFIGLRIDYTFTSEDLNILDHRILKTDISDHYPVLTTIDVDNLDL